ncbi:hypothetical protein FORC087_2646 [Bacillus cereus]|nr:hypothetical protein FORC087_2646 [Bacillus cereus]
MHFSRRNYFRGVHQEAKHTTIAGFSLGGLAAFYATLQNPHVFGNVLSMSGSVHWKKMIMKIKFLGLKIKFNQ